jgi:hypothetical protein
MNAVLRSYMERSAKAKQAKRRGIA